MKRKILGIISDPKAIFLSVIVDVSKEELIRVEYINGTLTVSKAKKLENKKVAKPKARGIPTQFSLDVEQAALAQSRWSHG